MGGILADQRREFTNPAFRTPTASIDTPPVESTPPPSAYPDLPTPRAEEPSPAVPNEPDWTSLVQRLQCGDPRAMTELYTVFARGIRFYLCRSLGSLDLDDRVHDAFLIVVEAIRRGELRDPCRLMGFVRTVVRRMVSQQVYLRAHPRASSYEDNLDLTVADSRATPEAAAMSHEQLELAHRLLREMSVRDREILERFYVLEQPPEQICFEMGLNETQFRLLKSRAKKRFGALGRRKLAQSGA
jgi:RNA polymerase sigma factor (sigma-70 family)